MSENDSSLVAEHHTSLMAYVRARVASATVAADIVQETWARALPSLRGGTVLNARAFLFRVARNLVTDTARDGRKWSPYLAGEEVGVFVADSSPDAERQALAKDRLDLVLRLVETLPPRCREAFTLRKLEGLEQAEICERLGITRGAVEKHLRHALLLLAARLGEIDDAG